MMIFSLLIFLLILLFSANALSLLDIHQGQMPMHSYLTNIQKDDALTMDNSISEDSSKESRIESRSIPIIEAPVAISNPVWNLFTRAGDFYRIFRRNSDVNIPPTATTRWKLLRVR